MERISKNGKRKLDAFLGFNFWRLKLAKGGEAWQNNKLFKGAHVEDNNNIGQEG